MQRQNFKISRAKKTNTIIKIDAKVAESSALIL